MTILKGKKLRFKFPTSGKQLLDVLRCFVKESKEDTVEHLHKKKRSLPGFLFEAQFHNYNYCGSKNLNVTVCSVDEGKVELHNIYYTDSSTCD